jgi:hypothetical protein
VKRWFHAAAKSAIAERQQLFSRTVQPISRLLTRAYYFSNGPSKNGVPIASELARTNGTARTPRWRSEWHSAKIGRICQTERAVQSCSFAGSRSGFADIRECLMEPPARFPQLFVGMPQLWIWADFLFDFAHSLDEPIYLDIWLTAFLRMTHSGIFAGNTPAPSLFRARPAFSFVRRTLRNSPASSEDPPRKLAQ